MDAFVDDDLVLLEVLEDLASVIRACVEALREEGVALAAVERGKLPTTMHKRGSTSAYRVYLDKGYGHLDALDRAPALFRAAVMILTSAGDEDIPLPLSSRRGTLTWQVQAAQP